MFVAALLAIALATPALGAQRMSSSVRERTPLPRKEVLKLTLGNGDPAVGANRYQDHKLHLNEYQAVQIDMRSDAFDPSLAVFGPDGRTQLAADDDSGGLLNARLRFMAPATGDYIVRTSATDGRVGAYTLLVRDAPGYLASEKIAMDSTVAGRFDESVRPFDSERPFAVYQLEGEAGDRLSIELRSRTEGMDPRLQFWRENGETLAAENDDFGGGRNSRLVVVLPATEMYFIYAIGSKRPSQYELEVKRLVPVEVPVRQLASVTQIESALGLTDAVIMADSPAVKGFFRLFSLPIKKGEGLTVSVRSSELDPVVEAGVDSPLGFASALGNDDRRSGSTDAELIFVPRASGTILLRVSSVNAGTGRFSLNVAPTPPAPISPADPTAP